MRLQAGLLKSSLRVSERHRAADSPHLHAVFLSAPCSKLSRLSWIHQDATKMPGHSHSENKNSSLVLPRSLRCGQKALEVSPGGCIQLMSSDVLRGTLGFLRIEICEWQ